MYHGTYFPYYDRTLLDKYLTLVPSYFIEHGFYDVRIRTYSYPCMHLPILIFICIWVSDLVPREAVEKWLKYLREELPAVAFKCSTQEQRTKLGWRSKSKAAKPSNILQTSDCLGADTLIKLLKNYSRSHEVLNTISFLSLLSIFLMPVICGKYTIMPLLCVSYVLVYVLKILSRINLLVPSTRAGCACRYIWYLLYIFVSLK